MATVSATWNTGNGNWFTAGNWIEPNPAPPPSTLSYVPTSNNDVEVAGTNSPAAPLVISYSGTDTVNSLNSTGLTAINITGGSLTTLTGGSYEEIDVGAATVLGISGGTLALSNGTFAGTVSGAGTLRFVNGTFDINAGFAITAATWLLDYQTGSNSVSKTVLNTNLTYANNFILQSPFGDSPYLDLNGHTLTLSGTASVGANVDGGGTLKATGTATLGGASIGFDAVNGYAASSRATYENAGSTSQDGGVNLNGTILNDAGATYTITAASEVANQGMGAVFTNNGTLNDTASGFAEIDGTFTNSATTTIAAGATVALFYGTETVGGTVSGSGTLDFGAGHNATLVTASLTVANITVNGGNGGGTLALGESLRYAGSFSFTDQFGSLSLAGYQLTLAGTSTFSSGAIYGPGSIKNTGAAAVSTSIGYGPGGSTAANAATFENAGTVNQDGNIDLNGAILNDAGATWTITAGNIVNGGTAAFSNSGTLSDTAAGSSEIDGAFGSTGTISIAAGASLVLAGGTEVVEGTVSGQGTLDFGYAQNVTLAPSSLTVASIYINGGNAGGILGIGENLSYGGTFTFANGFGYLSLGGYTLTLGGTSSFSYGNIFGPGVLRVTGPDTIGGTSIGYSNTNGYTAVSAATFENAGSVIQNGNIDLNGAILNDVGRGWTITAGNILNEGASAFSNSGVLADTAAGDSEIDGAFGNTGTISIAAGASLVLASGTEVVEGTVSGPGTLDFGYAQNATLAPASLTVASIYINGGNAGGILGIGENLSYGGTFTFANGFGYLNLEGYLLTLGGTSSFSYGSIFGPGAVKVTGSDTIGGTSIGYSNTNGYAPGSAAAFENAGGVNQTGNISLNGTILNDAGHGWTITSGNISNQGATFDNNGVLTLAAGVSSEIDGLFVNKGTLAFGTGSLVLRGTLTNDGAVAVTGGNLTVGSPVSADSGLSGSTAIGAAGRVDFQGSVAANQTVGFAAPTGTLQLDSLSNFSATVSGFTAGDVIDVTSSPVTRAAYVPTTGTSGTLALFNGSNQVGSIALSGDYYGKAFSVQADPSGVGTDIGVSVAQSDFNKDGKSDLLLQNSNGAVVIQTQANLGVTSGFSVGNPGPTWHVVGSADFDGDGQTDILLQNNNGQIVDYLMNGTTVAAGNYLGNPGQSWHVRGTGDFNGDGKADLVVQNDNSSIVIYTTNGASLTGGFYVGAPGVGWTVAGVADFNGDGHPDILVQNTNGAIVDYTMNGTAIASAAYLGNPGAGWSVAGTGTYNGSSDAGILLHNDSGANVVWNTNGTTVTSQVSLGNAGASYPTAVAGLDLNGDGNTDLVVQNTGSTLVGYTLGNTAQITAGAVLGTPGAGWSIIGNNPVQYVDGTQSAAGATVAATAGVDQFDFTSAMAGAHFIAGFDPAQDSVALSQGQFANFAAVQAAEAPYQGGTYIGLSSGSALVIQGVTPAQLGSSNFVLR